MGTELYRTLKELLGSGQWVRLESSLEPEHLGRQRMSWPGGTLGSCLPERALSRRCVPPARLVICGGGPCLPGVGSGGPGGGLPGDRVGEPA